MHMYYSGPLSKHLAHAQCYVAIVWQFKLPKGVHHQLNDSPMNKVYNRHRPQFSGSLSKKFEWHTCALEHMI